MRLKGPRGSESASPARAHRGRDGLGFMWVYDPDTWVRYAHDGLAVWLSHDGHVARYTLDEAAASAAGKEAVAPMTGKVIAMPVKVGQSVKEGDTLAILEAMKMEYRLEAEADGEVEAINAEVGELVDLGHVLVRLK